MALTAPLQTYLKMQKMAVYIIAQWKECVSRKTETVPLQENLKLNKDNDAVAEEKTKQSYLLKPGTKETDVSLNFVFYLVAGPCGCTV